MIRGSKRIYKGAVYVQPPQRPQHNMIGISVTEESTTEVTDSGRKEVDLSISDNCTLYYFICGTCIGGFIVVAGLMGNAFTLIIMGKDRKKSSTISCLFMLAIADSLVLITLGFLLIPLGLRKLFFGWWNGHNYNHITNIFLVEVIRIFNQISCFLTMLVTFQRYVSVCFPHKAKALCTIRLVNIFTAGSYVTSFLFYLPNFFFYYFITDTYGRYWARSNPIVSNKTFQILYSSVAVFLVNYIIPITMLTFMSVKILLAMKQQQNVLPESQERSRARKELTLSSVAIVVLFITCQSLTGTTKVLAWVYDPYPAAARCLGVLQFYSLFPYIAMCINSASNFAIYLIFVKAFRKKAKQLFFRKNRIAPESSTGLGGDTVVN